MQKMHSMLDSGSNSRLSGARKIVRKLGRAFVGLLVACMLWISPHSQVFAIEQPSEINGYQRSPELAQPAIRDEVGDSRNNENELVELRAILATTNKFQDALLQTVYWSLGSTLIVIGFLLGFSWFSNFRIYSRDRDAMRSELLSEIIARIETARRENVQRVSEAARESVKAELVSINSTITSLRSEIDEMEIVQLSHRVESLEKEENHSMVVSNGLRWLEAAVKSSKDWDISSSLNSLLRAIEKGGAFIPTELVDITDLLSKVDNKHAVLRDRVSVALRSAKIL